eukprot:TRINITY_DN1023_c0_g2_i1.p1 TRINITY_DN1023_c0_g2~~TRINITY_DN1023_c0_g2_i1.p1  ORF type:complete len:229 (-),score=71.97 TRINITY_DN1023_c0_g2_i1:555-1241(-)
MRASFLTKTNFSLFKTRNNLNRNFSFWSSPNFNRPAQEELKTGLLTGLNEVREKKGKITNSEFLYGLKLLPPTSAPLKNLEKKDQNLQVLVSDPNYIASIVLVTLRRLSIPYEDSNSWRKLIENEFKGKLNLIELIIIEDDWYAFFSFLINYCLRKIIPSNYHNRSLVYYGKAHKFKSIVDTKNDFALYAFLLDKQSKIIWKTTGGIIEKEKEEITQIIIKLEENKSF